MSFDVPKGRGQGPLAGLRVLDIATIVAAPSAAALLADYGAEVLKVELPGSGDSCRSFPPFKDGKPLWWKVTNRNKKLISLDLRKPEGLALLKQMLPSFDVLIENFRPGTLDKWGLDRDTLWSLQPRLVILRATAFGQTGPYRDRPGFTRIFEAMGGLTYITGDAKGEPMHAGYPIGDSIGGLFGALGVMTALWKRARDPEAPGEEIDLSLTEAMLKLMEFLPIKQALLGESHGRSGNESQYSAPTGVFATRDGQWISLSGSTNVLFAANCRAIDRADLITDPRYASNSNRCAHTTELNELFRHWFAEHDLDDVLERFERHEGTLSPIYSARQIVEDPQVQARGFLRQVPDRDFGTVPIQDVVPRFHHDPGSVYSTGGDVGQDNDEVYGDWLGLTPEQCEHLRAQKVI
ncbi:CoA transferase [Hydrogenophaga sp. 2FB]|uniref:CaiB/BaiF CoA transferase family protein n=1 Tax=Hydrogenophaga sp. 2FB TaxID=2502187 RepID=UPI0010F474DD|nr:CoA transferase [Hydrogenophaga sp. 2FB]